MENKKAAIIPLVLLFVQRWIDKLKLKGIRMNAGIVHKNDAWKHHLHLTEYDKPHTNCEYCNPPKEIEDGDKK